MKKTKRNCSICKRREGSIKDRGGKDDGIQLGPVTRCSICHRWACPDCLHESDCCFRDADDHSGEPEWCPPGWRIVQASEVAIEYEVIP